MLTEYQQDAWLYPDSAWLPPDPERDAHCWFTRGPWARLGKQGPWKRTMGWLWLIGPKGRLPL